MNWLALARGGYGALLLAAPHRFGGHSRKEHITTATRRSMRILAVRQLFEAAVCAVEPTSCILRIEAVVDAIHAGTMAAVAVVTDHGSTRRAAAVNVATAVVLVGADLAAMSRSRDEHPRPTAHANAVLRLRDRTAAQVCRALPYPVGAR